MAATESGFDPHPIIAQPETLGRWNPPMSNPELSGQMAANLWRAGLTKAGGDPELLIRYIMGTMNHA